MWSRSSIVTVIACAAILVGAGEMWAQTLPYTIDMPQQTVTLQPNGYIEFHMTVTNTSSNTLRLNVARTTNDLPDSNWITSICFDDLCFADTVSYPPTLVIDPGQSRLVKVNVVAGNVLNTTAHVVMEFSTFGGLNHSAEEFQITVAAAAVPAEPASALNRVYPNPTSTTAMIPIPSVMSAAPDLSLRVYDITGVQVADFSPQARAAAGTDGVQLDLSPLRSGSYWYILQTPGNTLRGSFVVAR